MVAVAVGWALTILPLALMGQPKAGKVHNSDGAPTKSTGGFGELTCSQASCHTGNQDNSGPGSFRLEGVPASYTAGTTYSINVIIDQAGQRSWGFELAARNQSGQQAGRFVATTNLTQSISDASNGVTYVTHTIQGLRSGTVGPATFAFDWVAPNPPAGAVQFHAAGNAADNDGFDDKQPNRPGDYIYTTMVTSNFGNLAPVVNAVPDQTMNEGATLEVAVSSTDPEGQTLSLSVNNLPAFGRFMSTGNGTGIITFEPQFNHAGMYQDIQVVATDNGTPPMSSTRSFSLTVNNVNRVPQLAAIADQTMNEGATLEVVVMASDPDGDNLTLTMPSQPTFKTIKDNGNGSWTISFSPGFMDAGVYPNIQVTVTDNGTPPASASRFFRLTVNNVNRAPQLAAINDQVMDEGTTLEVAVAAMDADGNALSLVVNNRPAFGSFQDNINGTGVFRFAPQFEDARTYSNIQVIARDNGSPQLSDTSSFNLIVNDAPPPAANLRLAVSGNTNPGQEFFVELRAGFVTDLFGVAFEMLYSPTDFVDPDSVMPGDFMGTDVIFVSNIDKAAGKISVGITRKAGQGGVSGGGLVASVGMRMSTNAALGQRTSLILQNVSAIDPLGNPIALSVFNLDIVTRVETVQSLPLDFVLEQNYPNPFNPETRIGFSLPRPAKARLEIIDLLGRPIRTLVDGQLSAGSHSIIWDGRKQSGEPAVSGVYVYRLNAEGFEKSRKLLLLK